MTAPWEKIGQLLDEKDVAKDTGTTAPEAGYSPPKGKTRASTELYNMVKTAGVKPFLDVSTGQYSAVVPGRKGPEVHTLGSGMFKSILTRMFFSETGDCPSSTTVDECVRLLEASAMDAPPQESFVRIGGKAGKIFLDLNDSEGTVVEISAEGWRKAENPPLFRRPSSMKALPFPVEGGTLEQLRPFLNLAGESDFIMACGWLFSCLRPRGPYGLLLVHGEHGSGKSQMAEFLKTVLDPEISMKRIAPRDEDSLLIAGLSHFILSFDNMSTVKGDMSDLLCGVLSGTGLTRRKLFSDLDEISLSLVRPVLLNGISLDLSRPDLLSRLLPVRTALIPASKRKTEARLRRDFAAVHPSILGALCSAASAALRGKPESSAPLPRLADLAEWINRAEVQGAMPWEPMAFTKALAAVQKEAELDILVSTPAGEWVLSEMERSDSWRGPLKSVLMELREQNQDQKRYLPANERSLMGQLERLRPLLRQMGIGFEKYRSAFGTSLHLWRERKEEEPHDGETDPVNPFRLLDEFLEEGKPQ